MRSLVRIQSPRPLSTKRFQSEVLLPLTCCGESIDRQLDLGELAHRLAIRPVGTLLPILRRDASIEHRRAVAPHHDAQRLDHATHVSCRDPTIDTWSLRSVRAHRQGDIMVGPPLDLTGKPNRWSLYRLALPAARNDAPPIESPHRQATTPALPVSHRRKRAESAAAESNGHLSVRQ